MVVVSSVPRKMLAEVGKTVSRKLPAVQPTRFEPLMIQGLQCLSLSSRQPRQLFDV